MIPTYKGILMDYKGVLMDYQTICENKYQDDSDFSDSAFREFEDQAIEIIHSFKKIINDNTGALPFNESDFEFVAYCVDSIKDLAEKYDYKDQVIDFSDRVWDTINKGLHISTIKGNENENE